MLYEERVEFLNKQTHLMQCFRNDDTVSKNYTMKFIGNTFSFYFQIPEDEYKLYKRKDVYDWIMGIPKVKEAVETHDMKRIVYFNESTFCDKCREEFNSYQISCSGLCYECEEEVTMVSEDFEYELD